MIFKPYHPLSAKTWETWSGLKDCVTFNNFPSWNGDWVLCLLLNQNHLAQEYPLGSSAGYTISYRHCWEQARTHPSAVNRVRDRIKATIRNTSRLKWNIPGYVFTLGIMKAGEISEMLLVKKWKCTEYLSSAWHVGTQARRFSQDHLYHPQPEADTWQPPSCKELGSVGAVLVTGNPHTSAPAKR